MTGSPRPVTVPRTVPEAEVQALVAIETAERLAVKAHQAIVTGDPATALAVLDALTTVTTTRTVTAVKTQGLSDHISLQASTNVAQMMAALSTTATGCTHLNCETHSKSPSQGVGCDGMDDQERTHATQRRSAPEPQYGFIGRSSHAGGI